MEYQDTFHVTIPQVGRPGSSTTGSRPLSSSRNDDEVLQVRIESSIRTSTANPLQVLLPFPFLEMLDRYNATRIHIQMGNIASSSYSSRSIIPLITGPAGLYIEADFSDTGPDTGTGTGTTGPWAAGVGEDLFLALLRDLVGTSRILLAPVGLSMKNPRLHRYIQHHQNHKLQRERANHNDDDKKETDSSIDTHTFSTTITEGTASVWSAESFVSIIQYLQRNILSTSACRTIWNANAAAVANYDDRTGTNSNRNDVFHWSNWMMGGGPKKSEKFANYTVSPCSRKTLWMEWQRQRQRQRVTHSSTSRTKSEQEQEQHEEYSYSYSYSQGVQYGLIGKNTNSNTLSFSIDNLIPKPVTKTQLSCMFSPHNAKPIIEIQSTAPQSESQIEWGPACTPTNKRKTSATINAAAATLDNSNETCFSVVKLPSTATNEDVDPNKDDSHYKLHFHIYRHGGQAGAGTLQSTFTNLHSECSAHVSILHAIPKTIIQPIWTSLQAERVYHDNDLAAPTTTNTRLLSWSDLQDYDVQFKSSNDQHEFMIFTFQQVLAPKSSFKIQLEYNPSFLSFEKFPGDANRGFDIPPVQATFQPICNTKITTPLSSVKLFSNPVILLTPLPDMSMPFNVLSFTCTLYAFIIGSLLNLLVKKANSAIKYKLDPTSKPKSKLDNIKNKVNKLFQKVETKLIKGKINQNKN